MYYQKIFFTLVMFAGLLMMGCNKDDKDKGLGLGSVTNIDLEKVMKYPYSNLEPEEQKAKLEQECIVLLNKANALKSLKFVDALEYLNELFESDAPVMKSTNQSVKSTNEVFALTDFYGVLTWDAENKEWKVSDSTSELKFIFPANNKATSNNATLSIKVENSNSTIPGDEIDFRLPKSVTATLTIDKKETAKIEFYAEYNKENLPVNCQYKITIEGYVYWYKLEGKGKETKLQMQLSYNKEIMIETLFQIDINLEELVDNAEYLDDLNMSFNVNGYMKLMDNIALVYAIDVENLSKEMDIIESMYSSNGKTYCDKMEEAILQYMDVALIAIKDGYKIADIIPRSELSDDGNYTVNYYLKFNDGTYAELEAFFSEGFEDLESKWKEFVDAY